MGSALVPAPPLPPYLHSDCIHRQRGGERGWSLSQFSWLCNACCCMCVSQSVSQSAPLSDTPPSLPPFLHTQVVRWRMRFPRTRCSGALSRRRVCQKKAPSRFIQDDINVCSLDLLVYRDLSLTENVTQRESTYALLAIISST